MSMKADRKKRLKTWAKKLTSKEKVNLLVSLVEEGIHNEDISFWEDALAPYCSHSGEPLVEGQKCYPDE